MRLYIKPLYLSISRTKSFVNADSFIDRFLLEIVNLKKKVRLLSVYVNFVYYAI